MASFIENPCINSDESPYPDKLTIHLRMHSEFIGKQSRCMQTANRNAFMILTSMLECIQEPCQDAFKIHIKMTSPCIGESKSPLTDDFGALRLQIGMHSEAMSEAFRIHISTHLCIQDS